MRVRIPHCARWMRGAAAGALLLAPAVRALPAQALAWTSSLYGTTGDYIFSERSTSLAFSNGLALTTWRVRLSASVPIIFQSTPWVAMGGAGPVPTGGPMHGAVGEQSGQWGRQGRGLRVTLPTTEVASDMGLGDPTVFGGFDLVRRGGTSTAVTITGGLKVPVASAADGFGTGEWDAGAGLAVSRSIGRLMFFLDGSYWFLGDMPDLPLRDVITYGGAVGRVLGDGDWSTLVSFSGSEAAIEGSDAPAQIGVMLSRRWQSGKSLSGGLSVGLTSSAPDVAASLGWRVPLGRHSDPDVVALITERRRR